MVSDTYLFIDLVLCLIYGAGLSMLATSYQQKDLDGVKRWAMALVILSCVMIFVIIAFHVPKRNRRIKLKSMLFLMMEKILLVILSIVTYIKVTQIQSVDEGKDVIYSILIIGFLVLSVNLVMVYRGAVSNYFAKPRDARGKFSPIPLSDVYSEPDRLEEEQL